MLPQRFTYTWNPSPRKLDLPHQYPVAMTYDVGPSIVGRPTAQADIPVVVYPEAVEQPPGSSEEQAPK
jgi:hypothetical protein